MKFIEIKTEILKTIKAMKSKVVLTAYTVYFNAVMKRYLKTLEVTVKNFDEKLADDTITLTTKILNYVSEHKSKIESNFTDNKDKIFNMIFKGIDLEKADDLKNEVELFIKSETVKKEIKKHSKEWTTLIEKVQKDAAKFQAVLLSKLK